MRAVTMLLGAVGTALFVGACGGAVGDAHGLGPGSAAGGADGGTGGDGGAGGVTKSPPVVAFTAPDDQAIVTTDHATFTGTASSDTGVASVFVAVGPNVPVAATSTDDFRTFTLTAPIPVGDFTVTAIAYDLAQQPSQPATLHLTQPSALTDAAAPTVVITAPPDGSTPAQPLVLITGTAADDRGVVKMDMQRNGALQSDRAVETADFFAHWNRLVPLLPGQDNVLLFTAYDAAGHTGTATITLHGPAVVDSDAPIVAFTSQKDGDTVSTDTLAVTGTASDSDGVSLVKVRVLTGSGATALASSYVQSTTMNGYATWTASVPIPVGAFTLEARAIDVDGVATSAKIGLMNAFKPVFSPEVGIPLHINTDGPPEVNLSLDRAGVNAIIDTDLQKSIQLLDLDPTALLTGGVNQIKTACGTAWQDDNPDPMPDCSLTPLGQTFHGADGTWQTSAEYSLIRILTMTPANVKVAGTSIEGLQKIADGAILGITVGGGFGQILAETLGIPRTQEIVGTDRVVAALKADVLASHPFLAPSGNIPVTLYDAMNDLTPLGTELGPAAPHPGVNDPSQPPHGIIFGPDFAMNLVATSNLSFKDGVDLSVGKDYIATLDHPGQDVLTFDFNDPAKFSIVGLTENPTTDLRFIANEDPSFISSCTDDGCKNNLPGMPFGSDHVWSTQPWTLEHVISDAAYQEYGSREFDKCYISTIGCQCEVSVGNPDGWTDYDVIFNLGDPPKDQYIWETIDEVAQVALHNFGGTTLAEGDANVAFTLSDIPVGLNAEQLEAAVRPSLQAQGPKLSAGLLGDYAKNNGPVDFYYLDGADGNPYLFFVTKDDPLPTSDYKYTTPGFFADAALTMKVSKTDAGTSGDSTHEKLPITAGTKTVYAADDTGAVYRVRLEVPTGTNPLITAWVSRKL